MARKADHRRADELHSCEYPRGAVGGPKTGLGQQTQPSREIHQPELSLLLLQLIFVFRKSSPDVVCIL
jgi:hypothetical protein